MLVDPLFRPGSHCQIYGREWRVTSITGHWQCAICQKPAYCPECTKTSAHTIPLDALRVRCAQHATRSTERSLDADADAE